MNYVIKKQLIENSLLTNQKYASKVAISADQYLKNMLQELNYSANIIGKNVSNQKIIQSELHRLKYQSNNFNTVSVIDKNALIKHFEPHHLKFNTNISHRTVGIEQSLKLKKTYISPPYLAISNNLIVLMTQPIFDQHKNYFGMITGSIHLQRKNLINQLLSGSYDYKKSYMYVVDQDNRIIFHPDPTRIGQKIIGNTGLSYMKEHKNGSTHLVNSQGVDNLAGFSHIPSVN